MAQKRIQTILIGKYLKVVHGIDQIEYSPDTQEEQGDLDDLAAGQPGMPQKKEVPDGEQKDYDKQRMGPPERKPDLVEKDRRTEGTQYDQGQDEPDQGDFPMSGSGGEVGGHDRDESRRILWNEMNFLR